MPRVAASIVVEKEKRLSKKIPASETGASLHCTTESGNKYTISQNPIKERLRFTLWKCVSGGYERIACANSPTALRGLMEK